MGNNPLTPATNFDPSYPTVLQGATSSGPSTSGAIRTSGTIADWSTIRAALNNKNLEEEDLGDGATGLKAQGLDYKFKSLGNGGAKTAYTITNTNCVLLVSNPGRFEGAYKNIISEISALVRIAKAGVRVPKPLAALGVDANEYAMAFNVAALDGRNGRRAAYLQEYLSVSKYEEYSKRGGPEAFFKNQIELNAIKRPSTLAVTIADLQKTRRVMASGFGWYDLQFMYNWPTGKIVVFDASEHPKAHSDAQRSDDQAKYLMTLDTLIALCKSLSV